MQEFNVLKILLWIKWQICAFVGWNYGYLQDVYEFRYSSPLQKIVEVT